MIRHLMSTSPIRRSLYLTERARFSPLATATRSEEHTSELQSQSNLVCRLLLEKKKKKTHFNATKKFKLHVIYEHVLCHVKFMPTLPPIALPKCPQDGIGEHTLQLTLSDESHM